MYLGYMDSSISAKLSPSELAKLSLEIIWLYLHNPDKFHTNI